LIAFVVASSYVDVDFVEHYYVHLLFGTSFVCLPVAGYDNAEEGVVVSSLL
jgi:hypothetical protein